MIMKWKVYNIFYQIMCAGCCAALFATLVLRFVAVIVYEICVYLCFRLHNISKINNVLYHDIVLWNRMDDKQTNFMQHFLALHWPFVFITMFTSILVQCLSFLEINFAVDVKITTAWPWPSNQFCAIMTFCMAKQ